MNSIMDEEAKPKKKGLWERIFGGSSAKSKRIEFFEEVDEEAEDEVETRITVEWLGKFDDDLAYGGERGVYLIKDNEKKTEYIGISGIGISERGSHTKHVGKVVITEDDER